LQVAFRGASTSFADALLEQQKEIASYHFHSLPSNAFRLAEPNNSSS
jgi:hypothetical protein